ncbi:MAG: tetratricopeptide repeat protein [Alistipes sp.]|nr:tetratricopeptide repeat protein [Alistipes sp.]MBR3893082.1 tetratricopeptide repeat protein [Alistipes sp.]
MRVFINILVTTALMLFTAGVAMAQYYPERRLVREGNEQFERLNYRNALNRYNEALEHDTTKYESLYNRANAYLQNMLANPADTTLKGEVANTLFEQIAADELLTKERRAEVLRNLGEGLFLQQNYEAALNSFRESLKLNPADREVKHNYILTKRIVDQKRQQQQQNQQNNQNQNQQQNQDQNQNNEGNNDQNQDQNQPENNENNQDKNDNQNNEGDQNEDPQNKDNNQDNKGDEEEQEGEAPPPSGISRDEQERMLDAIQAQEDKTNEKLKEGEKAYIIPGKKNW